MSVSYLKGRVCFAGLVQAALPLASAPHAPPGHTTAQRVRERVSALPSAQLIIMIDIRAAETTTNVKLEGICQGFVTSGLRHVTAVISLFLAKSHLVLDQRSH